MSLMLAVTCTAQSGGTVNPNAGMDQWVSLFNAQDLSGWTDALDNASEWRVAGGILEGRGGGPGHPAVLVTQRQDFRNYRLRVTFGYPRAGVGFIELRRTGGAETTSCYSVSCRVTFPGDTADRPAGNITKLKGYRYGGNFPPARVSERVSVGAKKWHTLEIVATGNHIVTFVDGQKADEFTDGKHEHRAGGIALVGSGASIIHIRDVQILELPE
jgi:hypothetical protein